MASTLKDNQSNVAVGLGTWTHTTTATSMYFVSAQVLENPTSSVIITISQSGSQSLSVSSPSPAAAQQDLNLQTVFNCVVGDVITVVLSSSNPLDQQLNTVKSIIITRRGL